MKRVKSETGQKRKAGEDDHGEHPAGSSADEWQPRSTYTMDLHALKGILDSMAEVNRQQTAAMMEHQCQQTAEMIEKLLNRGAARQGDGGDGGSEGEHHGATPYPRFDYGRAMQNFKRRMPSFKVGAQPFDQFCNDFYLSADQSGFEAPPESHTDYNEIMRRRGNCLKGLFYQCLSTEAKALAGRRLYPAGPECTPMTFKAYTDKMRLLFEPTSESEGRGTNSSPEASTKTKIRCCICRIKSRCSNGPSQRPKEILIYFSTARLTDCTTRYCARRCAKRRAPTRSNIRRTWRSISTPSGKVS